MTNFPKIDRLAADDFAELAETAQAIMGVSSMFDQNGIACLLDGSMYSPSTRALKGGTHAFHIEDNGASMEAYHEALDALCDAWSTDHAASMYWEDGCLWLASDERSAAS